MLWCGSASAHVRALAVVRLAATQAGLALLGLLRHRDSSLGRRLTSPNRAGRLIRRLGEIVGRLGRDHLPHPDRLSRRHVRVGEPPLPGHPAPSTRAASRPARSTNRADEPADGSDPATGRIQPGTSTSLVAMITHVDATSSDPGPRHTLRPVDHHRPPRRQDHVVRVQVEVQHARSARRTGSAGRARRRAPPPADRAARRASRRGAAAPTDGPRGGPSSSTPSIRSITRSVASCSNTSGTGNPWRCRCRITANSRAGAPGGAPSR